MVRLAALEQGAGPQVLQLPPERNMMQLDGGLLDLPTFVRASGEPWEVSIETVSHVFAEYVAGQIAAARQRHEALMAGGNRQPVDEVPAEQKEYEASGRFQHFYFVEKPSRV